HTHIHTLSLHDALPISFFFEAVGNHLLELNHNSSHVARELAEADSAHWLKIAGNGGLGYGQPRSGKIQHQAFRILQAKGAIGGVDRKSTRLNSSHQIIS